MSLTRTNNGFFKSEIQANLLMDELRICKGYLGHTIGTKNSNPVFAEYDNKGIIKVYKNMVSSNKVEIVFERKVEGVLTSLEVKSLASYKRKLKKLEKELEVNKIILEKNSELNKNSKNNVETQKNTEDVIEMCSRYNDVKIKAIEHIKSEIAKIEK